MNPNQYPPQPNQQGQPGYPAQGPYPPQPSPGYGPAPGSYPGGPQGQMPPQQVNPAMGYNPFPYPGEYDKPHPKGPNKMALGIVAVLLIVGVIVAVLVAGSGSNTSTNQTVQTEEKEATTSTAGADVVPRSDGRLDLSRKINSGKSLKAQVIQAKVDEQVNLSSGFSFMATAIKEYTSPNEATKPAEGKRFVVVDTVVGNRGETGNISVSYLDFRLRTKAGELIAGHITTNEILNNPLASPSELEPGEQISGKVTYEVAQADVDWVFEHSETYQKTTDNTTFVVKGEIVLSLSTATVPQPSGTEPSATGATPATPPTDPPVTP